MKIYQKALLFHITQEEEGRAPYYKERFVAGLEACNRGEAVSIGRGSHAHTLADTLRYPDSLWRASYTTTRHAETKEEDESGAPQWGSIAVKCTGCFVTKVIHGPNWEGDYPQFGLPYTSWQEADRERWRMLSFQEDVARDGVLHHPILATCILKVSDDVYAIASMNARSRGPDSQVAVVENHIPVTAPLNMIGNISKSTYRPKRVSAGLDLRLANFEFEQGQYFDFFPGYRRQYVDSGIDCVGDYEKGILIERIYTHKGRFCSLLQDGLKHSPLAADEIMETGRELYPPRLKKFGFMKRFVTQSWSYRYWMADTADERRKLLRAPSLEHILDESPNQARLIFRLAWAKGQGEYGYDPGQLERLLQADDDYLTRHRKLSIAERAEGIRDLLKFMV